MILPRVLSLTSAAILVSCSTVPDDAPQEYHQAHASLEKMDEKDVDDMLPQTAERAEKKFEKALNMLEKARDEDDRSITEYAAIGQANDARNTADNAIRLHDQIKTADKSEMAFRNTLAQLNQDPTDINVAVVGPESPFAKLKGSEVVSTVAYFDTASATDPVVNRDEMDALVQILSKDKNFRVILKGHADPRGENQFNRKLAMNRAQLVANKLRDKGIGSDQMVVESVGESSARTSAKASSNHLQLDRRVQATLILQ
ncbi:OmpA family protein [Pseudobacteriovorax antillogorgiicola]|uniref:OmpA family protein n=1 Tax=Pseudobacteriovorax antillogorgiicola TaxID=1513793 RepID=A0A1Y6BDC3_9BACT|nr:OmpA family protein [Pseudobacteriovorax antillogorgiicola]TCS56426.1 OmpA family protein [Pseudobacteriovorax antillogorgiicola]SMF05637.1 OmpA family protein [Pseudobacteriovorax antillogorgiicola]